jgi:hypothetical protein
MKNKDVYSLLKCGLAIGCMGLLQACSLTVPIDSPNVSEFSYSSNDSSAPIVLTLDSGLQEGHKVSKGKLPISLSHEGRELEATPFVFESLKKELASRKLPIEIGQAGDNVVELLDFSVIHHRVSGFSPMVTISTMSANLKTKDGTKRIASMVKRAKVPVWTMDEINDPCYNEPIELLIKEFAAKINRELLDYSLSDDQVSGLISKINSGSGDDRLAYFDVYELGFSNNPKALEALKGFSSHKSDYVRMAAISSLGILEANDYFEELKSIYHNGRLWQDRGMALKAIGDLGGEKSTTFLLAEKQRWEKLSNNEATWNKVIIDLYI